MKQLRPKLANTAPVSGRTPAGHANSRVSVWALWGGITGALLAFALNLPAQWLANGVHAATHGQVQLQEAQGSVWKGSGKLVLTGGAGSRDALALPGPVHWHMHFSLNESVLPSLNLDITAACCTPQAVKLHVTPLPSLNALQLKVEDHQSNWPAQWLSGLGAPWNTLQPEGNLVLETQQWGVRFGRQETQVFGRLSLTAYNLSSKLSTLRPMGTYQLSLASDSARSQQARLSLTTQSGSLLLTGQGQWQGTQFQFRGEASAVPEHAAALSNLLNIIGRRQGARSLLSLG